MRRIILLFVLLILAACAPQAATEEPSSATPEPAFEETQDFDSVEDTVIQILAENLGLEKDKISVKSNEEVKFGDDCLDIAFLGATCTKAATPGRVIILEANGMEYQYHTSVDGDSILPATLALTWTREGGIAGFCDRLTVFLSGEIYGTNCRSQPTETVSSFATLLSASELKQFNSWFLKYGEVNLDFSDPVGVADGMTNTLVFYGNGSGKPSKTDEQALFTWAQNLFQKLHS